MTTDQLSALLAQDPAASSIDNVYFFQYGKCKKFYFFVFVSHIYKRRTVFLQGVEEIFLFLCKKQL